MGSLAFPLLNGHRYSFASVEATWAGRTYLGFKALDYSFELKPGVVRGASPFKLGRTRGTADSSGSMDMYMLELQDLIATLGPGFMEIAFPINVAFSEGPTSPVITHRLKAVRITKIGHSHKEGNDPLSTQCDLDIMDIDYSGLSPVNPLSLGNMAKIPVP